MQEDFAPKFSNDDFADDPEIRKERLRKKAYDEMLQECISIIQSSLFLESSGHKNLKSFFVFKNLTQPFLLASFTSNSPFLPLHVSIVQYHSSYHIARGNNAGSDDYLFGVLTLKHTYPKTMIVRETLREKIADLVTKNELDFAHAKKFSRKFYVLTEDKQKLSQLLDSKPLNELTAFPNMEAEISGASCLFRLSRNSISPKHSLQFTELAKILNKVLN